MTVHSPNMVFFLFRQLFTEELWNVIVINISPCFFTKRHRTCTKCVGLTYPEVRCLCLSMQTGCINSCWENFVPPVLSIHLNAGLEGSPLRKRSKAFSKTPSNFHLPRSLQNCSWVQMVVIVFRVWAPWNLEGGREVIWHSLCPLQATASQISGLLQPLNHCMITSGLGLFLLAHFFFFILFYFTDCKIIAPIVSYQPFYIGMKHDFRMPKTTRNLLCETLVNVSSSSARVQDHSGRGYPLTAAWNWLNPSGKTMMRYVWPSLTTHKYSSCWYSCNILIKRGNIQKLRSRLTKLWVCLHGLLWAVDKLIGQIY